MADLVSHVAMAMRRLPGMLAAPGPSGAALVSAAEYYRPDQRFSAATNADRIESARRGAAALAGAAAAGVTEDLLLPAAAAAGLRAETGWDQVTLIAALTGRRPLAPADARLIQASGAGRLALG